MLAAMARVIALAPCAPTQHQPDWLRPLIVSGCALALILARVPLPL